MNVKGRIRRIKMKVHADAGISKGDKLIVIQFRTEAGMNRLIQERMDELRQKYGPRVSEHGVLVICVRIIQKTDGCGGSVTWAENKYQQQDILKFHKG